MFKHALRLPFRLLGIPLYLDLTFLLILPLLAWLIGNQLVPFIDLVGLPIDADALDQGLLPYVLGLIAAVALFISVVIHELGHALVARRFGVETERITLWLLGGMAHFKKIPRQRGAEALVAIAGPITSFALAALGALALLLIPTDWGALYFVVAYTTFMNVALATFNLIPALPLDGGRVLRSLLALRMDRPRATQIAATISRVLAIILGIFGLLSLNIFLILIAVFVYIAVAAEARFELADDLLRNVPVSALMSSPIESVPAEMPVEVLLKRMLRDARHAYPVHDESGSFLGLITLNNLQRAAPEDTIAEHMSDLPESIDPDASASELLEMMSRQESPRVLVRPSGGPFLGIITRTDLFRALQLLTGRAPASES
ncbi:site-2 protease family protein [Lujinxingia litoralis]|uniref:Zinc metalloprotease n=1 Tax=Lujinxingia litoralis TaxID=2211119 RepID=A0A328CBV0_9DELT|nr:site-2 protease family protein [Lujinxingia litoralis]RAL23979.1 site-2 protease family protein [Lujinxingia litoralis]